MGEMHKLLRAVYYIIFAVHPKRDIDAEEAILWISVNPLVICAGTAGLFSADSLIRRQVAEELMNKL